MSGRGGTVDAIDSKSIGASPHEGSSPSVRTVGIRRKCPGCTKIGYDFERQTRKIRDVPEFDLKWLPHRNRGVLWRDRQYIFLWGGTPCVWCKDIIALEDDNYCLYIHPCGEHSPYIDLIETIYTLQNEYR